jgi:RNA polymerase sigma-70 factor (ECF subfamily)
VQAAVDSLTPKLREALLLIEVFGLSYREAAEVLRVPDGTVKSRVFQARQRLAAWQSEGGRAHEL